MKTKHLISALVVCFFILAPKVVNAKKHKDAPDKTIVLMLGTPNETFDESQFPHLDFYYLPDIFFMQEKAEKRVLSSSGYYYPIITTYHGSPDFIVRWGSKKHLVAEEDADFIENGVDKAIGDKRDSEKRCMTLLLDKNGVVAYQRSYSDVIAFGNSNIMTADSKRPKKKSIDVFMKNHVRKEKVAKLNKKKSYIEGEEPTYRGWDKGDIEGMKLPDFEVQTSDGQELNFSDVIDSKPSFIVFYRLISDRDYSEGSKEAEKLKEGEGGNMTGREFLSSMTKAARGGGLNPLLWHIENVMYGYYQSRDE